MYGAKFPLYCLWLAKQNFSTYFFYTAHILHISAFDILQYFAFSYISIICSLYLHKFSYDSQIHNVLTCVNKLHFSEWIFFILFYLTISMIQKLGCMIHCVSHPFWNLSYLNHKFTFFSSVWLALFQSTIPPNPTLKKMHFCYTFTFSIIHPTLSHPIQLLKLFCSSVRLSLFQSSIPPNPTFEIVLHFLITFPFFNLSSHPNPTHKHKI